MFQAYSHAVIYVDVSFVATGILISFSQRNKVTLFWGFPNARGGYCIIRLKSEAMSQPLTE